MKIGVIGIGVVGEATSKILEKKHEIFLYDKYREEYSSTEDLENLATNSEVVFVCVPTPAKPNGEMDCSAICDSLNSLKKEVEKKGRNLSDILVVIRSTAVPGTADELAEKYDFRFASNPEFLTEKNALKDMEGTNRIIIGTNDEKSKNQLVSVYSAIFPKASYVNVDIKTAEMIKYAANVTLISQIANSNELYQICKRLNVDYNEVKKAILLDGRIGRNISVPGPDGDLGFGGKCFPKDLKALISLSEKNGYDPKFLKEIWELNKRIRENKDWLKIPGATSKNNNFGEKNAS
jgi:UDPglucose 6-dehydrogenase